MRCRSIFLLVLAVALATGCSEPISPEPDPEVANLSPGNAVVPDGFPLVIVRQGAGAAESTAAGAPVVDNLADAIELVATDGLIRVTSGTYPTLGISIRRPVTIEGHGEAPLLVPAPSDDPTQAFTVVADGNTTIRNLRFEGYTSAIQVSELGVDDPYDLVLVEDVHIEAAPGLSDGLVVFSSPPTAPQDGRTVLVRNSTIVGGWRGFHVQSDVPNFVAVGNTLTGQKLPPPMLASAIGFSDGASGRIEGNVLTDCEECINVGGGDPTKGSVEIVGNHITIDIDEAIPNVITGTGFEVRILDNVVEGVGGAQDPHDQASWPIHSNAILVDNAGSVELRGNRVSGAWTGYSIGNGVGALTALDNVADGVGTGLLAFEVDGPVTFQSSDFTDYHISLHVDDVTDFDATCNWWGAETGPSLPEVFDPGIYTPWATQPAAGTSTTTCGGGL